MKLKSSYIIVPVIYFITFHLHAQAGYYKNTGKQQFCQLGDFVLESGEKIYDCKIGYRTYGKADPAKSNIILVPTWFGGTSEALENSIPGKIIDTVAYQVILADALGNGVSSSPSNSKKQPRLQFPKFSIRDMVESQYQLLTKELAIQHLYAIAGISMGGSQSFQWAVSYPGFADKIIPIVSSPQNTTYDLLLWRGLLESLQRDTAYQNGNYTGLPVMNESAMWNLVISTPEKVNTVSRDSFDTWFMKIQNPSGFDWNNMHRQVEAIFGNDISNVAGGSLEQAATMIKAKMLIIVANQDYVVHTAPAIKFARMINARVVVLDSNCGHLSFVCDSGTVTKEINAFLTAK